LASERTQRRIDRLLDEAERALDDHDWPLAAERARDALLLDDRNQDARNFLAAAERAVQRMPTAASSPLPEGEGQGEGHPGRSTYAKKSTPASFVNGRYLVRKFLGEGGKKRVYLAHDSLLDREVAFALIKTDGLDDAGRDRITREAQAMGRLGSHPHIVSVFDLGEERVTSNGQRVAPALPSPRRERVRVRAKPKPQQAPGRNAAGSPTSSPS